MSEIEIDHRPKIFDDPDYCDGDIECRFRPDEAWCLLFGLELTVGDENSEFNCVKCPECKIAYQRALKKSQLVCVKCGKPRKIVAGGGFELPCPHCGDEIPF